MTELPYNSRRYYLLPVNAECLAASTKPDNPYCANGFGRRSTYGGIQALSQGKEMYPKDCTVVAGQTRPLALVGIWSRMEAPTGGQIEHCSADPAASAACLVPNVLVLPFLWSKLGRPREGSCCMGDTWSLHFGPGIVLWRGINSIPGLNRSWNQSGRQQLRVISPCQLA